jgi:TnpA family transposase
LHRTLSATRYLAEETYRRRVARQLNKGENLLALVELSPMPESGALRRRYQRLPAAARTG